MALAIYILGLVILVAIPFLVKYVVQLFPQTDSEGLVSESEQSIGDYDYSLTNFEERDEFYAVQEESPEDLNALYDALFERAIALVEKINKFNNDSKTITQLKEEGFLTPAQWQTFSSAKTEIDYEAERIRFDAEQLFMGWGSKIFQDVGMSSSVDKGVEAVAESMAQLTEYLEDAKLPFGALQSYEQHTQKLENILGSTFNQSSVIFKFKQDRIVAAIKTKKNDSADPKDKETTNYVVKPSPRLVAQQKGIIAVRDELYTIRDAFRGRIAQYATAMKRAGLSHQALSATKSLSSPVSDKAAEERAKKAAEELLKEEEEEKKKATKKN